MNPLTFLGNLFGLLSDAFHRLVPNKRGGKAPTFGDWVLVIGFFLALGSYIGLLVKAVW